MRRLILGLGLVVGLLMLAAPAFAAPEQVGMVDTTKGEWHLRNPDGGERVFTYGVPGDIPLLGDWNCDGVDTPGAFRPSTGFFFFTNTNPQNGQVLVADISYFFGAPGDIPLVGDWDKDGCDSAGIYRNGTVYSRDKLSTGFANRAYFFGNPGDRPFATDWDGDGRDSVGIYRSSSGKTFYTNDVPWNGVAPTANDLFFGITSDQFVPGDWDGNPTGTVGIYRPSDGNFYLRNSNTTGTADIVFGFGQPGWTPVAGDTQLRTATLSPSTTTLDLGAVGLNREGAATVRLDFSGGASDADLRITSVEFGQNGFDYSASELANYDIGFGESRFLQIKMAPTTLGVKRGFVRIRHTGANSPLIVNLIGRASYRVNAGGDPIEDWGPDSPYGPGGSVGPLATSSVSGPTAPDEVFESYRFGQQSWDFPVTPGAYDVNLYFAETFPGTQSVGARIFDVDIEGIEVLDNFDIFAAAGANNGIVRSFTVVSNANLDIDLRSVVNSAAIQGIEIIPRPQWNSLGAAPSQVNYGSIAVGDTLKKTITVVHLGEPNTGTVNIPGASIIGANANQFAITSGAGARTLSSGQTYTVTVEFRPTAAGVFNAQLFISHSGVNSPLRVDLSAAADDVILYRLNTGGDAVVGQFSWSPDEPYLSPNSPTGEFAVVQAINTSDQSIPPGTPLDVLRTERFGSSSVPMRYDLPVPNGAYEVRLYFLEAVHNAAGVRVFDVNVEFGLAINDLDIWQRAGKNKAIMIPIQTTVSGGNLDIDLIPIPGKNLPAIHGIEVIRKEGNAFLDADPVSLTLGPIGTAGTTTATVDFEHNGGAGIPSVVVQNVAISGPGASRFTLISGPQVGTVFPPGTSQTASVRFTPGVIGDKSASLNVTYNGGRVVSVPLTGSVNNPPFVANPGTRNATEGTAFSVTVTASDPDTASDGDFRAMTATGVPAWATVTTGDGFLTISGTPGFAASGTSSVTVTVTDPDGLTDSETFSIVVANFNRPPTFSQDIPNQTNTEGDAITLSSEATDLDGDDLTWSASGLPGGLTINPASGLISGTIGFGAGNPDPGVFEVLVTVTDNGSPNKSDTDGFFWTVFDANQPPTFNQNLPNRTDNEGAVINLGSPATDPDDDGLTWSATGLPGGLSINPATGVISGTIGFGAGNPDPGVFSTVITVTDDGTPAQSATDSFSWTVNNVNRPPTFNQNLLNRTDSEGVPVIIPSPATDLDGNSLTYSATGLPGGISINGSTGLISGTIGFGAGNPDPGVFNTVVTVTDNGSPPLTDTDGFFWTVNDVNRAPTFNQNLPNRTDTEGDAVNIPSPATDLDGDNLTYSATGLPGGISINSSTGTISGTIGFGAGNPDPGVFETVVTVTDNGTPSQNATDTFFWTVNDFNQAPTFNQNLPNREDAEGDAVSIPSPGTDPDGDDVTYSATGLPGGISMNPTTGLISGTIGFGAGNPDPGVFETIVTITDDRSPPKSSTDTFFWTVNNTNQLPTASATAPASGFEGVSVAFFGSGSDPDGTIAGYLWTFGDGTPNSTAQNPNHVYANAGTYNGSLVVTDNDGDQSPPDPFTIVIDDRFTLTANLGGSGSGSVTSAPAGIGCPGDCSQVYNAGTSVTVTASPSPGSTFTGWTGAGCAAAGTGPCSITMNADQAFTAVFDDVNDPPALSQGSYSFGPVAQSASVGTAVGSTPATDPEGDTVSYGLSGAGSGDFSIDGSGNITTAVTPLSLASYSLTVTATATGGQDTATVLISTSNGPPALSQGSYSFGPVAQSASVGTAVGSTPATDPEGDTVSYGLSGAGSGDFSIDGSGNITTAVTPLSLASYSLTVTATATGGQDTATVLISTSNGPPALSQGSYSFGPVAQSASVGTAVGSTPATDPEGDTVSYGLSGAGSGDFSIDGSGNITTAVTPLSLASYSLTVTATATGGQDTATVSISTSNGPPALSQGSYSFGPVAQSASVGTAVGSTPATDPEGDTVSYGLSGAGSGDFSIDGSGNITTAVTPLSLASYSLTVTATATGGQDTATVSISTSNGPPTFSGTPYSFSVAGASPIGTGVGAVSATDPEGQTVTYSLTGTGSADFSIDGSGNITTAASPLTGPYTLTVVASTPTGPDGNEPVTINIT